MPLILRARLDLFAGWMQSAGPKLLTPGLDRQEYIMLNLTHGTSKNLQSKFLSFLLHYCTHFHCSKEAKG